MDVSNKSSDKRKTPFNNPNINPIAPPRTKPINALPRFIFGLLNGVFRLSELLFDTSIQMLRNIPHLALIPLVILWFGIDEWSKIFLVALGVLFPIYINTYHGIQSVDKGLIEMGKAYGLKGKDLFLA